MPHAIQGGKDRKGVGAHLGSCDTVMLRGTSADLLVPPPVRRSPATASKHKTQGV